MNTPKKIKDAEDRILGAVGKGVTCRDRLIKVGTNFTRNIDTCVTGCGAGMIITDLVAKGVLVERFDARFGSVEITLAT